jgi:hypothetical protein
MTFFTKTDKLDDKALRAWHKRYGLLKRAPEPSVIAAVALGAAACIALGVLFVTGVIAAPLCLLAIPCSFILLPVSKAIRSLASGAFTASEAEIDRRSQPVSAATAVTATVLDRPLSIKGPLRLKMSRAAARFRTESPGLNKPAPIRLMPLQESRA